MNYLTNYYKNLSEQLQEKLNILQTQVNESIVSQKNSEEEKINQRTAHILRHGPTFLYQLMTGNSKHSFGGLSKKEQQLFVTRHGIAREVYNDKDFMGGLPANPDKRNNMIAREIARRGDMGLDDGEHARKSHEYAIFSVPNELK